ncbi:MAG TPA: universal stress protein, partial [Solirubrobacteraceae bacterium]|nr:universal stress protein [Solirubrobacteraceae bacterium]
MAEAARGSYPREGALPPKVLVSYDGTDNDVDALALGRVFAQAGADLALAYVRHNRESAGRREELAEHEAETLLTGGARWIGMPDVLRYVVVSGSTADGLRDLAEEHGFETIVFGSEYRTAPLHVQPGASAERLLASDPAVAVGIAPAGLRVHADLKIATIAAVDGEGDPSAQETAASVAEKLGARILERATQSPDLLVVGSRAGT